MIVIGSTNQYDTNGLNEQGGLVARIKYNGTFDWGQAYWESFGTIYDDGVVAADLLALPGRPLLLAMNHLKGQKFSISTLEPATGWLIESQTVDVDSLWSNTEIIKACLLYTSPSPRD